MTESYFIKKCIVLLEISEDTFKDIGDVRDFREEILVTLD